MVQAAIEKGDPWTSVAVLRGLGRLGGKPTETGSGSRGESRARKPRSEAGEP